MDLGVFKNYGRGRRQRRAMPVEHLPEGLLVRAVEAGLDYNELIQEIAVRKAVLAEKSGEDVKIEDIAIKIIQKQEADNLEAEEEGFESSSGEEESSSDEGDEAGDDDEDGEDEKESEEDSESESEVGEEGDVMMVM